MEQMLSEIVRRCTGGERLALCVLVRARGSTPQAVGAKMLVLGDGQTIGTLGGGCVEAEVRSRAIVQISTNLSALFEFRLDHDYGWDDGLICGGVMHVYVRVLGPADAAAFSTLLDHLHAYRPALLDLAYESAGEMKRYIEELGAPPKLVIAGAGHVGKALGALSTLLDFQLTVIDDRADFVSAERFPTAAECILGEIETELRRLVIDPNAYIVIVTRGHRNDGRALAAVVESPARYIGLIGSRRKIKTIFDELAAQGVSTERLARVHAPIGFEIGAVTPAEIAVSIAAELIAVRRGRDGLVAPPMKMDEGQLRAWLARAR